MAAVLSARSVPRYYECGKLFSTTSLLKHGCSQRGGQVTTHRLCCINLKNVGFTQTENEIHTTQQKCGVNTYMKNGHNLFTVCPTVTLTKSPLEETLVPSQNPDLAWDSFS